MRHAGEREREESAYRAPHRAERSRNTQSWWLVGVCVGSAFSAPGTAARVARARAVRLRRS
eukprot:6670014-Prymnesium_polylepis.1